MTYNIFNLDRAIQNHRSAKRQTRCRTEQAKTLFGVAEQRTCTHYIYLASTFHEICSCNTSHGRRTLRQGRDLFKAWLEQSSVFGASYQAPLTIFSRELRGNVDDGPTFPCLERREFSYPRSGVGHQGLHGSSRTGQTNLLATRPMSWQHNCPIAMARLSFWLKTMEFRTTISMCKSFSWRFYLDYLLSSARNQN